MPIPSGGEKLIQQGHACNVIFTNATDTKTLALVQNASYNEDTQVIGAQCLGFFGEVSQDAQGYKCSLSLGTYVVLRPNADITVPYLDGGEITIERYIKTRQQISEGQSSFVKRIDFIDLATGTLYNSFSSCTATTNGAQINPNAYVTKTASFVCIERLI